MRICSSDPHKYGYGFEANIYPTDKIQVNYYPFPIRLVDIPMYIYE